MSNHTKETEMARRRYDREGGGFARKLATWAAIGLIVVWAARNPHQALTVIHYIASAIARLASHYGKHSGH
jgi:hypothetical protein